jgi:hypothetical protein
MMRRSAGVTLEERFINANASSTGNAVAGQWRVVRLFEGGDGVRYAALANAADPSLTKTVATAALRDRSLFRRAG